MSGLNELSYTTLIELANALENQRLFLDASLATINRYVPPNQSLLVSQEFSHLQSLKMNEQAVAYTLRLLAQEQKKLQDYQDQTEVVWTVPHIPGNRNRDTSLVVEELFRAAQAEILIATYVLDKPRKTFQIFQPLIRNMARNPDLKARIILTVKRPYKSQLSTDILLHQFSDYFKNEIWGNSRHPEVFYDTRALNCEQFTEQYCLHSKFIIVDQHQIFLTSANFTEAAHQRNIETGILLRDTSIARNIIDQVELLIQKNILLKVSMT